MPMLYGIFLSVTALTEASRHLLKRQGKKLKRHGAVTLGRFGGNPAAEAVTSEEGNDQCQAIGRPYTNCTINFLGGTHEKAN